MMKINLVVKHVVSRGSGAKNSTPVHLGTRGTWRHIVTCPLSKSRPWITEASRNIAASLNCVRNRRNSMTHFSCQQIVWETLWYSICWWCLFALCFCWTEFSTVTGRWYVLYSQKDTDILYYVKMCIAYYTCQNSYAGTAFIRILSAGSISKRSANVKRLIEERSRSLLKWCGWMHIC